nr:hypothetical protein Man4p_00017 [Serratia proteamaculans]ULG18431.1 hypothetical protein Man4p_00114 [Serratia proteamaculans]
MYWVIILISFVAFMLNKRVHSLCSTVVSIVRNDHRDCRYVNRNI